MKPRTIRQILESPRTPDELRQADEHIRRETQRIQSTWAPEEEWERRVWKHSRATIPVVSDRGGGGLLVVE